MIRLNNLTAVAAAVALSVGLAACGGGGSSTTMLSPQEQCEADGGQYADGTCTTAAQLAAEAKALADAQAAARAAWIAARSALAGIAGKEDANPAAYQRAQDAVADAKAAYDAAMAATTSEEAERHQMAAEDANTVAMEQTAMVEASYGAPALDNAQMAAKSAADAAKAAYDAAMAALANIEAIKSEDMASYDMAKAKVDAAKAAYDAAKAASDAAAATSVLADAQAHQRTAEAELAKANAANMEAMQYAGMVQTAHDSRVAAELEAELDVIRAAARTAWQAARDALAGLAGKEDANPAAYQRAQNAVADAKAAYDAAMAATTVAEAEGHRDVAQAASMAAATQADMVVASYEAPALEKAQMAAASAAGAAKEAYDAAMAALAGIEEVKSDDMASYDMAKAQVDAAKAAYDAAKAASDAAAATDDLADAQMYQQTAEAELVKANAANMDAMRYAGMVQTAADTRMAAERAAEEQRQMDVADARSAAMQSYMDAEADATKAEAEAAAAEAGDPGSQVAALARAAADAARAAANAAKAAHDTITDGMTKAEADAKAAEAATAAGTANAQYMVAENLNSGIQAIVEARERQRQMDVTAARTAAMGSYTDADADADKAEAAADAAEAGDPGSAGAVAARAAATAARTAADAAQAAHDAITDGMTKAEADAKAAEAAAAAGTANSQYMVARAANEVIQTALRNAEQQRVADVAAAREAAMQSYMDADADADKAEAAADAAEADDPGSAGAVAAREAATAARAAANAAQAAHDAITDGMTKAEADAEATKADTQADTANSEYMTAMEQRRVIGVAVARAEAMQSYMDADADADKAEAEAAEAKADAPDSPAAAAAEQAAMAARVAANAAKAAHDAITDDMTVAQADEKAGEAADEAGTANAGYKTAMAQNNVVKNIVAAQEEQQRKLDVAAVKAAVTAAETAKNAADQAADDAEEARDNAEAALMKARAARTDATTAEAEYEKAKAAATAARTAADAAETAYMAAMTAAEDIDDATAADAKTARMTAETKRDEAQTAEGTAETQQTAAETAEVAAMTASGVHVLELFKAANGAHVMDVESTEADEKEQHANNVGAAMAMVAGAADGNQAAGATNADTFTAGTAIVAAATWPGDTVANPDASPAVEFSEGTLSINVTVNGGTQLPFRLEAVADDPDTTGTDESAPQTAEEIGDLGVFDGYEVWEAADAVDTTREGARVIVFTNKQKGDDSVLEVTGVSPRSVRGAAVATDGSELAKVTSTGNVITGVEWTPSGETALTGTLSCPANTACSITLDAAGDGTVDAISGYTFTGSRAGVEAVAAAAATDSHEYLIFGLWLDENADGTTDTIGAFADGGVVGGNDYAVGAPVATFTGTATYNGVAAGAHHKTGEGVNWFHGDARLTADFGAIDTAAERGTDPAADTSPGTISGEISNIRVAGGDPLSDSIVLRQAALTAGTATFNGDARMGAGEIQDDDTVDYPFEGTWSGSFYGATANDPDTPEDESITDPLAAAGTFGVTGSTGTGDDMVVESFVGAFGAELQP